MSSSWSHYIKWLLKLALKLPFLPLHPGPSAWLAGHSLHCCHLVRLRCVRDPPTPLARSTHHPPTTLTLPALVPPHTPTLMAQNYRGSVRDFQLLLTVLKETVGTGRQAPQLRLPP